MSYFIYSYCFDYPPTFVTALVIYAYNQALFALLLAFRQCSSFHLEKPYPSLQLPPHKAFDTKQGKNKVPMASTEFGVGVGADSRPNVQAFRQAKVSRLYYQH